MIRKVIQAICLILCLWSTAGIGQKSKSNGDLARHIYLSHLNTIQDFLQSEAAFSGTRLDNSLDFLEPLTKIKSLVQFDGYGTIGFRVPTRFEFDDWKRWYRLNKKQLYFENDSVVIKNRFSLGIKPKKRFKLFLREVKRFGNTYEIDIQELNYLNKFFIDLTAINEIRIDENCDCMLPNKVNVIEWQNWFKKNKHLLYWDDTEQKIKLPN